MLPYLFGLQYLIASLLAKVVNQPLTYIYLAVKAFEMLFKFHINMSTCEGFDWSSLFIPCWLSIVCTKKIQHNVRGFISVWGVMKNMSKKCNRLTRCNQTIKSIHAGCKQAKAFYHTFICNILINLAWELMCMWWWVMFKHLSLSLFLFLFLFLFLRVSLHLPLPVELQARPLHVREQL